MEITMENLIEKYGKEDAKFVIDGLEIMVQKLEDDGEACIDNFRVALKGDPSDEEEYENLVSEGCCGFYDDEIESPSGNTYMIGCNYGH